MVSQFQKMKLFTGTANPALAQEIATLLGVSLGGVRISRFANGEIYVRYDESIRGADVFVVQPFSKPVNETLMELLIMIDALKRASAGRITAVIPFYAYARQEKKTAPREPITARMVADILTSAGADRILTMDLHSPAIQGFFNIPCDNLTALPKLSQYIKEKNIEDGVVIAPDAGSVKKAEKLATYLHLPLGVMYKRRPGPNVAEMSFFIGDVKGKSPIIIDDMIDTAGSLEQVINALEEREAKEIHILATHGVFSPPALERLNRPSVKELVVCNTLPLTEDPSYPKLKLLSVAPLFAEAIQRIHENNSVSVLFD
ncbi:ribose-phosphate diphosphokinase [Capillibacterium thermochitinicola]|uniref:Ribose-phosphate pyrophosphokinase n=1 Tax=Capillibacterium thermochitinicola TaxID=2699427 RepID=A0A8J6LSU8_9FIRM|nr:ribose-phosphate pyrophosphokinase [Capillibacterium thermochitinicola]MBA2133502.1 ribose-phosphate pyrophosphokinase [Capillibacterium thermochitinicola]